MALAVAATAAELQPFEAVEPHMGTLVRVKLYAAGTDTARQAFRAAFDRIEQLDAILSDYKPDSEMSRLPRLAVRHPVAVSPDLFRVLEAAQQVAENSGGAFDVTIGPVVRLWRAARKQGQLPDPDMLDAALAHCGYRKLHLDPAHHTVTLDQEGMQLDAGGIGKGYAAGEALAAIERLGIGSALVAVSGDLAFADPPPGHSGWKIDTPAGVLELARSAVSTSGDAEQHLDINGRRYSHIIDPLTGWAMTRPITVTVVARRAIDADALATAISVLGEERGRQLLRKYPSSRSLIR